jgi:hypothetical protein
MRGRLRWLAGGGGDASPNNCMLRYKMKKLGIAREE